MKIIQINSGISGSDQFKRVWECRVHDRYVVLINTVEPIVEHNIYIYIYIVSLRVFVVSSIHRDKKKRNSFVFLFILFYMYSVNYEMMKRSSGDGIVVLQQLAPFLREEEEEEEGKEEKREKRKISLEIY